MRHSIAIAASIAVLLAISAGAQAAQRESWHVKLETCNEAVERGTGKADQDGVLRTCRKAVRDASDELGTGADKPVKAMQRCRSWIETINFEVKSYDAFADEWIKECYTLVP